MRRFLIAGNWKLNGGLDANRVLLDGLLAGMTGQAAEVAVCVPAPYLGQCQATLKGGAIALGAQDVSEHAAGAYTGEVAASMLREFDCQYVIVGHSERRAYHGETNDAVGCKALAALNSGMTPIICVGETLAEREAGTTDAIVCGQLDAALDVVLRCGKPGDLARLVVAYEPVWAIGTGKTATPQMAQDVHSRLRACLVARDTEAAAAVRILYGGSMKPENAAELLAMDDIDGGLIGGASLKAADFLAIIKATE